MKKRNRQSFGRTINWQRTKVVEGSTIGIGDSSPYWEWTNRKLKLNPEDDDAENPQANPDMLGDWDDYDNERHYYHQLIAEGYQILSPREKQVFNLLAMKMDEYKIARKLNTTRNAIKSYRERIKNKFSILATQEA